jgi:hypothetical protein
MFIVCATLVAILIITAFDAYQLELPTALLNKLQASRIRFMAFYILIKISFHRPGCYWYLDVSFFS